MRCSPLYALLAFLSWSGDRLHAQVVFYTELPYFSARDSPFYEGIQAGTIISKTSRTNSSTHPT